MSRIRKASPSGLAFVLVKAFGDLTIASSVLRRVPLEERQLCSLLIAPHLADLCALLAPGCEVEVLNTGNILPPLFDLKKHGLRAVLKSAFELRHALAHAARGRTLVFDRLSYRERTIVGGRAALPIGAHLAPNVYTAHEAFLERTLPGIALTRPLTPWQGRRASPSIGLFPYSRVAAKDVPAALMNSMARRCLDHGAEPVLFLLEGEQYADLPGIRRKVVPRRFASLAQAICDVDGILSADSLPAHLAEYHERPAFVASPVPNAYYMPPSTFAEHHWGLFSQENELLTRLDCFLCRLTT